MIISKTFEIVTSCILVFIMFNTTVTLFSTVQCCLPIETYPLLKDTELVSQLRSQVPLLSA